MAAAAEVESAATVVDSAAAAIAADVAVAAGVQRDGRGEHQLGPFLAGVVAIGVHLPVLVVAVVVGTSCVAGVDLEGALVSLREVEALLEAVELVVLQPFLAAKQRFELLHELGVLLALESVVE